VHEESGRTTGTPGSTFNLQTGENLVGKEYYAVSPFKNLERTVDDLNVETLRNYVNQPEVAAKLNDPSGMYSLGTWTDTSTGKTYLDVVVTVPDRLHALQIAADADQKAIFDLKNLKEIQVPPMKTLYHWGRTSELEGGVLDPEKWGTAEAGAERRRALNYGRDFPMRTYYLDHPTTAEPGRFGPGTRSRYLFEAKVPEGELYDLINDPQGFRQAVGGDITMMEKAIKEAGYVGYKGSYGYGFEEGPFPYAVFRPLHAKLIDYAEALERVTRPKLEQKGLLGSERGSMPTKGGGERGSIRLGDLIEFGKEAKEGLGEVSALKDINDLGVWGAAVLARGFVDRRAWDRHMIADFGEAIRPNLDRIYKRASWNLDRLLAKVGPELLPNVKRLIELYKQGKSGERFYEKSATEVRKIFGKDADLFIRLLAATSPMNSVEANLTSALKAYLSYKRTGRIEDGLFFKDTQKRLQKIIEGETDFKKIVPRGPKVQSFAQNLFGHLQYVTVDRWIAKAFGWPETFSPDATYRFMDYAITQVAREINKPPAHVQAGIWKAVKDADIELGGPEWNPDDFGIAIRRRIAEQDPNMLEALQRVGQEAPTPKPRVTTAGGGERGSIRLGDLIEFGKEAKEGLGEVSAEVERKFIDRFGDLRRFTAEADLPRERDPYVGARLYAGRGGKIVDKLMDFRDHVFRPAHKQKLLDDMIEYGLLERYEELAGPRHNITKFPEGITIDEVRARKAAMEQRLGEEKLAQIKDLLSRYRAEMNKILTEMKDSGVISQAGYERILQNNEFYLPLERVEYIDANLEYLPIGTEVFSVPAQHVIHHIKGSEKAIRNPIEATIARVYRAVSLIERNKVATQLANLAGDPRFKDLVVPLSRRNPAPPAGMGKFSVLRDGRKYEYAVPQVVADAIRHLRPEEADIVTRVAAKSSALLRAGATGLNLAFFGPNVLRDVRTAILVSEVGFTPFDFLRGLAGTIRRDADYRQFLRSGGAFSGMFESYRRMPKAVADVTGQMTLGKAVSFANPLEYIRFVGETLEMSTRLGVFKRARHKGYSDVAAAYASRNATVDFAKSGELMRVINLWVPFLNARAQGIFNVLNTVKDRPAHSALILGTTVVVPTIATYLYNVNNHPEIWRSIAQFEKDNNIIIIFGDEVDEEGNPTQVIKIPKSEQDKLVANPIENFLAYLDDANPKGLKQLALQVGSDLSPIAFEREGEFSPSAVLASASPPAIRAAYEWATGTNLYTGRRLIPQSMEKASPEQQYKLTTPKAAVAVGRFLGISPLKVENTVSTMVGGLGRQIMGVLSGDLDFTSRQISRRFYGAWGKQEQTEQFDRLRKYEQAAADINVIDHRNAQALYERILKAPPEQRKQLIIDRIQSGMTDGEADRLIDLLQQKLAGTTPFERALGRAPIEARARYMLDELQRLGLPERQQRFEEWAEKGLFTPAVVEKMGELIESGQFANVTNAAMR